MKSIGIVALSVAAAIAYGIVHDQVTARICVEYFTIGHDPILDTTDPTALGFLWGVLATWWVGLLLGIPLAFVARVGRRPKCSVQSLIRPIGFLLLVMGVVSAVAGLVGWLLARAGWVMLVGPLADSVPADRQIPFIADLWAHSASYLAGFIGGLILINRVWQSRRLREIESSRPPA